MWSKIKTFSVKLTASFFFVGYFPFWSGAFGSLAGILLAWYFPAALIPQFIVYTLLGFLVCAPSEKAFGKKDPSKFVMDEVSGMMLTVLFVPHDPVLYVAGYVLFRIFDVWKPWLIRRIQNSGTPSSIMWDDLAAGLVSNLLLQAYLLLPLK